jgi:FkbM family methyltransferase
MEGKSADPKVKGISWWLLAAVLVLLGIEVARGVGDLRRRHRQAKHASAQAALAEPSKSTPSNELAPESLAPRLLDDRQEFASYLTQFPKEHYRIVEGGGQGRFYLDDGHDLIKDELRAGKPWEPETSSMLQLKVRPGSTVLDVGAHIGTHTLALAKAVGPEGRVYAFEPQRKIHRELVHNLELNDVHNVVPLRFAVGDTVAVIEMNPSVEKNEGHTAIGAGGDKAELRTIDSFGFRNVSLMKIDVESFEDHVLVGARATILRDKPTLFVEIQANSDFDTASPELRAKIVHTIQLIEQMGYFVTRLTFSDYMGVPRAVISGG